MRAVLQRVTNASVTVNKEESRPIGAGLVILLGVMESDTKENAIALAKKVVNLRIFTDEDDKMNLSLLDIKGGALIVSNFTLGADCKKGNRPSFTNSAHPDIARPLYEYFIQLVKEQVKEVQTGEFGADMRITLTNDGPVTIVLDM